VARWLAASREPAASKEWKTTMYLKIFACEVAVREIGYCAAFSPHILDLEFLPVGHHDEPKNGQADLQRRLEAVPAGKFDAILIGYGICNLILNGLKAVNTRLIVPRAHDCITLFLGSKERYQQVFDTCPGTYYFTSGWLEFPTRKARAKGGQVPVEDVGSQASPFSLGKTFAELAEKYGEDNARYLIEVTASWTESYKRGTLIGFGFNRHPGLRNQVAKICEKHGWQMDELEGDLGLFQRWLCGEWNPKEFLVVEPGQSVAPTYNESVIEAR
jgi:hypothetical protein